MLVSLGSALLVRGGALASTLACCCARWCHQIGVDICGYPTYGCTSSAAGAVGPCTEECATEPTPCECGPTLPCGECYQCTTSRTCERIPSCCGDGGQCPPCYDCVDNVCVPCPDCTQCVDGVCVPCGDCQKCVDGECVQCGQDEECVDGVCLPAKYYCCYNECEDEESPPPEGENDGGDPPPPPPRPTHCQRGPCGYGVKNGEVCDLHKSGPYDTPLLCAENCQRYECVPDPCGGSDCTPNPDGPHQSKAECLAACPEDPCAAPCQFGGSMGPGVYSIDACERDICVSYVSTNAKPIRVQIWAPVLDENCNVIASRVIKADSAWRCDECCDCPNTWPRSNDTRDCQGGPAGQVTWHKPRGVTSFEVEVTEACGATAAYDIQVCTDCVAFNDNDWAPCACDNDQDCNQLARQPDGGCHCCDGVCQPEPCPIPCERANECPKMARYLFYHERDWGLNNILADCAQEQRKWIGPDANQFNLQAWVDANAPDAPTGCVVQGVVSYTHCCDGVCSLWPCSCGGYVEWIGNATGEWKKLRFGGCDYPQAFGLCPGCQPPCGAPPDPYSLCGGPPCQNIIGSCTDICFTPCSSNNPLP